MPGETVNIIEINRRKAGVRDWNTFVSVFFKALTILEQF